MRSGAPRVLDDLPCPGTQLRVGLAGPAEHRWRGILDTADPQDAAVDDRDGLLGNDARGAGRFGADVGLDGELAAPQHLWRSGRERSRRIERGRNARAVRDEDIGGRRSVAVEAHLAARVTAPPPGNGEERNDTIEVAALGRVDIRRVVHELELLAQHRELARERLAERARDAADVAVGDEWIGVRPVIGDVEFGGLVGPGRTLRRRQRIVLGGDKRELARLGDREVDPLRERAEDAVGLADHARRLHHGIFVLEAKGIGRREEAMRLARDAARQAGEELLRDFEIGFGDVAHAGLSMSALRN